ncbi:MAG: nitroreductase family deazaflavin-dependent oxidoreductase [Chloroflexota bacterium]|nr:MAG: nitroreductase family deazaflavin-dependent oxidoreductase [Chloroflexota bacterium]
MPIPDVVPFYGSVKDQLIAEIREFGHAVTGIYVGRQALVLTTTGARSGEPRVSPLAYSMDDGRYVVTASRGGSPRHPSWYLNLVANPIVTIEVDGQAIRARAIVAAGRERERLWNQHIALHPGIGAYRDMTSREIPVVVLEPIR